MTSKIQFRHGDLLEYTRPVDGRTDFEGPITVRGVVVGFDVSKDLFTQEIRTNVWVYEGSQQLSGWETDTRELEGIVDKEREIVSWPLNDLVQFDNFKVVRRGNSIREVTNFVVGGDIDGPEN